LDKSFCCNILASKASLEKIRVKSHHDDVEVYKSELKSAIEAIENLSEILNLAE
jgi:hypothetical protein